MQTRRNAYLGALKFKFQGYILEGVNRRRAWKQAKRDAAEYAFHASSTHLITIRL